jgi:FkbM family methyltransferase
MTSAHQLLGADVVRTWGFFTFSRGRFRVPFALAGQRFLARPIDATAVVEIVLADEYASVETLLAHRRAPLVVDLGANVGLFALRVFAACPAASLVCIEAAPDTADVLLANTRLHPARDWRAVHAAAWREDGTVTVTRERASTGRHVDGAAHGVIVPALGPATLFDRLLERRPIDLLKIDIEGAEETFLDAAVPYLDRVAALLLEIHPDRCDARRVRRLVSAHFDDVRTLTRGSSKPLLVATRRGVRQPASAERRLTETGS